jgi:ribosomal protein L7/L12
MPDDIGLILQCNKCVFVEEQGTRYIAGEIHNDAKQAVTGYVLSIDLQDAKGQSVKKIPGLMLMEAMSLQPGESKKFKERVLSDEANVTQASVYFKKAGSDVKLSNPLVLKLQR